MCAGGAVDPELFFAETIREQVAAARVCVGCPVRSECLAHALEQDIQHGVWGCSTARQRREQRRRTPDVRWRDIIDAGTSAGLLRQLEQLLARHELQEQRRRWEKQTRTNPTEPDGHCRKPPPVVNRSGVLTRRGGPSG